MKSFSAASFDAPYKLTGDTALSVLKKIDRSTFESTIASTTF